MSDDPVDYEEALKDPAAAFGSPGRVVAAPHLTGEQKMEILKRWEADARLLMTASDENMSGGEQQSLADVQDAMRQLEGTP